MKQFAQICTQKNGFITLLCLITLGCATAPPTQEMSDARQSIEAAESIGADQHAPVVLNNAQQLLNKAQTDIQAGDFEKAQKEAMAAREAAREALAISQARQLEIQKSPPPAETAIELKIVPEEKPQPEYYIVNTTDSLWSIAAKESVYGNPLLWPLIYKANAGVIMDADLIFPGLTLIIEPITADADIEAAKQHALQRKPDATKISDEAYLRRYGLR